MILSDVLFQAYREDITVISVVNKRMFVFHTSMARSTVSYSYTLIDEGNGIEGTFLANKVRWHKSCFALFNSTKLKRAEKRRTKLEDYVVGGKFTHSNVSIAQKKLFPPVLYATSVMAKHFTVSRRSG